VATPVEKVAKAKLSADMLVIEELRRELESLRSALKQVVEQYSLRVGGQLAELVAALPHNAGDRARMSAKAMREMLGKLRSTKLKPAKGRTKDLTRIARLVDWLVDKLPEES
jgi:hypothetical protein